MRLLPIRKISRQSKRLALFLTFCAGYVDAYTFIVRGNTLVAGQTGNVVFLSVELIKNNVSDVRDKVLTLLAFMMGVFLLTIYKENMTGNIKRTMLAFGDYFRTKHTPFLREGFIFVSLLSSFVLGVVFSAYLTIFYHEKTILGVPIMMSVFYLSMLFASWQKKVKEKASF